MAMQPTASDATGRRIPMGPVETAHGPFVRLLFAMAVRGADASAHTSDHDLASATALLEGVVHRMDADVSHVDREDDLLTVDDANATWSIAWTNRDRTSVSIVPDSPVVIMDGDGHAYDEGSPDLHLVSVRHERTDDAPTIASMSATIDLRRLEIPPHDRAGRSAVHLARTVAALVLGSTSMVAMRRDRTARGIPVDAFGPASDKSTAALVGLAALLDAERDDVLELPAGHPDAEVRLRCSSPLAEARCDVGPMGATAVVEHAEDRLPGAPVVVSISTDAEPGRAATYVVALVGPTRIEATIGGHDPVDRLRLARLAAPYRSTADSSS
jgi:hypothetical protein